MTHDEMLEKAIKAYVKKINESGKEFPQNLLNLVIKAFQIGYNWHRDDVEKAFYESLEKRK